jgi:integrase
MYNWALSQDLVDANPCQGIPAPGQEHRRDRVLSEDEIKTLWKEFTKEELSVASTFKLRLLTAQRGGEVHSIEWHDLDLEDGWWTIPSEKAKNKLTHRVPLTAPVVRIFEDLRKHQDQSKTRKNSSFVFPAPRGGGHLGSVQKAVERIRERSGIEDFTAHDLRRTAASLMTGMGIPRLVVSKILNHVEPGVTAVYDRYSYDRERSEALEAWARRLTMITSDLAIVENKEA